MEIDPVVLEVRADLNRYRAELRNTTSLVSREMGQQEARVRRLESEMRRSTGAIGSSLKGLAATLAGAFTGRELIGLLDSFTRFQNNLRVAGLEGENLAGVQDRLFEIAQRYGVELESLSGVFLKANLAQKELGASTEQILKLNEITAAALKITGSSAAEAQGALLQLGQALGSGVVRAEEFNSILEGALPLAQAAARGIDGFGGSVSKLRAAIADGQITSQQFFEGILRGGVQTLQDAEKATLTLSAGFTTLKNALTVYFGEADKANGVSAALGEALKTLAENLDAIIPALAVIGTALGVGFVANALKAAAAARGLGAALLTAFGGPVGLAITGIVLGLGSAASASAEAEAAMLANARAAQEMGVALSDAEKAALAAANETEAVGSDAATAEPKIWSFKNSVDGLTESLYKQARAARAARIELLQKKESEATERLINARSNTTRGQVDLAQQGFGKVGEGDVLGGGGDVLKASLRRLNNFFRGGKPAEEAEQIITDAQEIRAYLVGEIERLRNTPIGAGDVPAPTGGGGGVAGTGGGTQKRTPRGATGPTLEEIEDRFQNERASLMVQYNSALRSTALSAEEAAEFELRNVELARLRTQAAIEADENYSKAQKQILSELTDEVADREREAVAFQTRAELERDAADLAAERGRAELEALRLQYDLATTQDERRALAYKLLETEDQILREKLQELIDSKTVAAATKDQARIALAALNATAPERRAAVDRYEAGPLGRYAQSLEDPKTRVEAAVVRQLERVNEGITDAISKAIGVDDPLINDLLGILLEEVLLKPLANALKNANTEGGGDLLSSLISIGTSFFGGGRASGGRVNAGTMYRINEGASPGRVEGFVPDVAGQIVPLGRMNLAKGGGQGGGVSVVRLELSGDIDARIEKTSGAVAVEVVRASAPAMIDAAAGETIRRANRRTL